MTRKENPDSLFKTIGRLGIIEPEEKLAETSKGLVSDFYYKYLYQLMDQMSSSFRDLSI